MRAAEREEEYEGLVVTAESDMLALKSLWPVRYLTYASALDSWRYRYIKRSLDFLCALTMIIAFAIPGLVIAAAIVLTSEGPVFYCEQRIGRNGRLFRIWKFRSMIRNTAQNAPIADAQLGGKLLQWRMNKLRRDPRITTVGSFLRRWSLDEIPQLLNVLRGEMSLVGPRPIVEVETDFYGDLLSYYLAATPGLSGLWQVSGRSHVDYAERAQIDALYVSSWSLQADLAILFRTVPAVLVGTGAR